MTPFIPNDSEIQRDIRRGLEASSGYQAVFGTDSPY